MRKSLRTASAVTGAAFILTLLFSLGALAQNAENSGSTATTGAQVSFKLDSWITQGMYLGERWVSPLTYTTAQNGNTCSVESRVQTREADGKSRNVSARWIASDPEMVTVAPLGGNAVRITVHREGQSTVNVISEGYSETLTVKAASRHNAMQVEISRPANRAAATAKLYQR